MLLGILLQVTLHDLKKSASWIIKYEVTCTFDCLIIITMFIIRLVCILKNILHIKKVLLGHAKPIKAKGNIKLASEGSYPLCL